MVDLMDLLRDVLVCSLQVWMLNDFGKNMFPYRVGSLWKRIGVYFAAALCIFIANHMGTTLFNITIIPVSYTIAAIIIFQGSKWKKVIMACSIVAHCGTEDIEANETIMLGWKEVTLKEFKITSFSGGHFFPHSYTKYLEELEKEIIN